MSKYILNTAGVAAESFGNEIVLINLLKGNYYSLRDEVSVMIWPLIEQGASKQHLLDTVSACFEGEASAIEAGVSQLLEILLAEELILAIPSETYTYQVNAIAKKPFVAPLLEIHTDLQAMIMLDPVHDVDSVKGWPHQKSE